jgi:lysozyme
MQASANCLNLIKASEGFRANPYLCPAGIPTIGWGSTRYGNGTPVKLTDPPIAPIQAEGILKAILVDYESAVNRYVSVPINQNQFDALVDFAYNAGAQNLRTSTLLKLLNKGQYAQAANEFDKWVMGGGKRLGGLVTRRAQEKQLFLRAA